MLNILEQTPILMIVFLQIFTAILVGRAVTVLLNHTVRRAETAAPSGSVPPAVSH